MEGERLTFIINDSVEVCYALSADGVHLGQEDLSPQEARQILGEGKIIGLSTHSLTQVRAAQIEPVDYLGFGPIFASPTKSGHAPVIGIPPIKAASEISVLPIVAIGGITAKNVAEVYRAGAASAAVVSDLASSPNIAATVLAYKSAFLTSPSRLRE